MNDSRYRYISGENHGSGYVKEFELLTNHDSLESFSSFIRSQLLRNRISKSQSRTLITLSLPDWVNERFDRAF